MTRLLSARPCPFVPPFYNITVLLGILSDTHDRAAITAAAVRVLREAGAEYFIHCGDVGSEQVLDLFAGLPAAFVWGNTDWDQPALARYAQTIGVRCLGTRGDLELDGKRFAVLHGDDAPAMRRVLDQQLHHYLLHGHTHARRDERLGHVRIINPGALHRAREKTVALLDTGTDRLRFITIPEHTGGG